MERLLDAVLIHRRWIAAALVALAVWSALSAVTHAAPTQSIVVAARDLPSGSTITAEDLTRHELPPASAPTGLLSPEELTGRRVAGAMRRGEVFTDRRAVTAHDLGHDRLLAVAEIPRAAGEFLRAGDEVTVVAVDDDGTATTVADRLEVVTVQTPPDRDTALIGVAATAPVATQLARMSLTSRLTALPIGQRS